MKIILFPPFVGNCAAAGASLRGRRLSSPVGVWGRQPPRYPLHTTRIFRPDAKISGKVRIMNRRFRKMSRLSC